MGATDKEIRVTIKSVIQGLKEALQYADALNKINDAQTKSGGEKVTAGANAGEIQQLTAVIEKLAEAVESLEPGRLAELFKIISHISEAVHAVKTLREMGITFDFLKQKGTTLISGLRRMPEIFSSIVQKGREVASAVGQRAAQGVSTLKEKAGGLSEKLPGLGGGLGLVAGTALAVAAAVAAVAAAITVATVVIRAFEVGIGLAADALKRVFNRGLEYNKQLETTRLGIAAVLASVAQIQAKGATAPLQGFEKLQISLQLAREQLEKLKIDAINTTATFAQIAPAYLAALGPGLAAGLKLDEIRGIVVKITQAAGAIGLPFDQLNQEVRAILEGTINEDARLAKILGISNEQVKNWKQQGTLAAELNKRLAQFAQSGELAANTFEGLTSNLEEAFDVFSSNATQRTFEALKEEIGKILPQLFDFKNARLDDSLKPISDLIDEIFTRGIGLAGELAQEIISLGKAAAQVIVDNRDVIGEIVSLTVDIVREGGEILGFLVTGNEKTASWRGELEVVRNVLQGVLALFKLIAAILPYIRELVVAIGGGAFATFIESLRGALNLLGSIREVLNSIARKYNLTLSVDAALSPAAALVIKALGGSPPTPPGSAVSGEKVLGGGAGRQEWDVTGTKPAASAGGGRGGGGRESQIPQLMRTLREKAEEMAARVRAGMLKAMAAGDEQAFNQLKDSLEREKKLLDEQLEDRLTSIRDYYAERENIEARAIQAEIVHEQQKKLQAARAFAEKLRQIQEEQRRKEAEIDGDKKTPAAEKDLQKQIAAKESELKIEEARQEVNQQNAESTERINQLIRERERLTADIARNERDALRALAEQEEDFLDEVNRLQGRTSQGAIREINNRLQPLLEKIIQEEGSDSPLAQLLREFIALATSRAQIDELMGRADRFRDVFETRAAEIGARTAQNVIAEERARREINKLLKEYSDKQLVILRQALAIAEANKDWEKALDIRGRIADIEELKNRQEDFNTELKNTSVNAAATGLQNLWRDIVSGAKSAKEALRDFALGVLDALQQVIVKLIIIKILSALLGFATGGVGAGDAGSFAGSGLAGAAGFAEGGHVQGPGTETSDSIWARLSNNEFVQPAHAVKHYGVRFMEMIRTLSLPRSFAAFAEGGLASNLLSRMSPTPRLNFADGGLAQVPSVAGFGGSMTINNNNHVWQFARPEDRRFILPSKATLRDAGRQIHRGTGNG